MRCVNLFFFKIDRRGAYGWPLCLVYYLSRNMRYQFITFLLRSSILASGHNRLSDNDVQRTDPCWWIFDSNKMLMVRVWTMLILWCNGKITSSFRYFVCFTWAPSVMRGISAIAFDFDINICARSTRKFKCINICFQKHRFVFFCLLFWRWDDTTLNSEQINLIHDTYIWPKLASICN